MRNPKGKNSYKKRVQYDFNKLLIRETRDSPYETCKLFVSMYSSSTAKTPYLPPGNGAKYYSLRIKIDDTINFLLQV